MDLIDERIAFHMKDRQVGAPVNGSAIRKKEAVKLTLEPEKESVQGAITLKRRLIPVPQWNSHHEFPKLGQLRDLLVFAEDIGFEKVIPRVGSVFDRDLVVG